MNEQKYQFDRSHIIRLLLPIGLRQTRMMAWMQALLFPLEDLLSRFANFRAQQRLKLSISSQVVVFEKYLNDVFNQGLPGIRISHPLDAFNNLRLFKVTENESNPVVFTSGEYATQGLSTVGIGTYLVAEYEAQDDFIVNVPHSLSYSAEKLHSLVTLYKLGGMRWQTQTY